MSQNTGNWLIGAGAAVALLGLCALPAALGEHHDPSILAAAGSLFSLGILTMAGGVYLKASTLNPQTESNSSAREASQTARKQKGGCEACQSEAPVIQCTVHRVHLCGNCLSQHYDFRSCAYIPTTRRTAKNSAKSMAAKARA